MEGTGGLVVAVDTIITRELENEELARDLVHRLQNLRRDAGLGIGDRITSFISGANERMRSVLEVHGAYIRQETLSLALSLEPPSPGAYSEEQTVERVRLTLGVQRVQ